jgi:hypothetical protein
LESPDIRQLLRTASAHVHVEARLLPIQVTQQAVQGGLRFDRYASPGKSGHILPGSTFPVEFPGFGQWS